MLIAILSIEAVKLCVLCVLVYNTLPRKKKTVTSMNIPGGWVPPGEEPELEEGEGGVTPITEKHERDWLEQNNG